MPIHPLKLEELEKLDLGKASAAFNLHLKRAAVDCLDRPGDTKPRKVTLDLAIVPVIEQDGSCERVKAQLQVTSKIPSHRTRVYDLGIRKNGVLVFSEDSPENFDQQTFFDNEESDRD